MAVLRDKKNAAADGVARLADAELFPVQPDLTAAITRFTDAGGGVVFVSSELTEMIENCDRILLIKYNRIVGELRDVPRLGLTEDSLMAAIQ